MRRFACLAVCAALLPGCAALPIALGLAADLGFGAAGVVQRQWQHEEIKALRLEVKQLREQLASGKQSETSAVATRADGPLGLAGEGKPRRALGRPTRRMA